MNSDFELLLGLEEESDIGIDFKNDELVEKNKQWEIDNITLEYFSDDELLEQTKKKLKNNYNFKVDLLNNLEERMNNIFIDDSVEVYKELISIIHLLSYGEKYKIFENYNEYSTREISKLFSSYESLLTECFQKSSSENSSENFELNFKYYMALLEAFKELCIINLIDVVRKKTIQVIINAITESINTIKFSLNLDEEKISALNIYQGDLILRFSNIVYISTENKNIDDLIKEYKYIYNKQVDGYLMSSNKDLNVSCSNERTHYISFLAITTKLLLLLLFKLKKYKDVSFDKLDEIISVYSRECQLNDDKLTTIEEFHESLLNNFVYLYDDSLNIKYQDLTKYILDKKNLTIFNMEIIHNMVLFSKINEHNLIYILRDILKAHKMDNDFYEYHKLEIIDTIINKFIQTSTNKDFTKQIPLILEYMKNSNTATNLMSVFSKIRLSLAHYFSLLGKEFLSVSQEQYFIGERVCAYTLIKNEYKGIYEKILLYNAKVYFESLSLSPQLNDSEMVVFGEKMMQEFFINKEIKNKYDVNISFDSIIEYILKSKDKNLSTIESHISTIISQKIFYNLAVCTVVDSTKSDFNLNEVGYEIFEQNIINGYKIVYKYSYSYEKSFNDIFISNEDFIKKSVTNILLSYLNVE